MKKRVILCTSVLLFACAIVGFAAPVDEAGYPDIMKKAVAANRSLQMSIMMADWPSVATNATAVQGDFKDIEAFCKARSGTGQSGRCNSRGQDDPTQLRRLPHGPPHQERRRRLRN